MKKLLLTFLGGTVGFVLAWVIVSQRSSEQLLRERAHWQNEKSALEAALETNNGRDTASPSSIATKEIVRIKEKVSPGEIIQRLQKIKILSGAFQTKNTRLAIQQFETLISAGPTALPDIREFLLRNEEIDYESSISPRASKEGKIHTEFILPPSLRFGLFDAARQIGGSEAEELLAEILSITGRGAEVAYLARVLQEMAPFKYREQAVNAAREMLLRPAVAGGPGLDKYDREYLYGVLALYGDASFAAEAQSTLVRADGAIDRGALKYLQQTLGVDALAAIAQAYQDPSLPADKKEPLIRYALTYAGADAQATAFWHKAITDPATPLDDRRELIEDLNQDGIQNEDNPTARDAYLIAKRLELVASLHNEVDNPAIRDAWREAGKDLQNMGLKFLGQPSAPYQLGMDLKELRDALLRLSQASAPVTEPASLK